MLDNLDIISCDLCACLPPSLALSFSVFVQVTPADRSVVSCVLCSASGHKNVNDFRLAPGNICNACLTYN